MSDHHSLVIRRGQDAPPPYEQIREQITLQIFRGELTPDQQLPTVFRLATDLELSQKTVSRAYRELIRDGLIRTDNAGTYVGSQIDDAGLSAAAGRYASRAHGKGLTLGQASIVLAQHWPRDESDDAS